MAYTTINKPNEHFNTVLYTGDGSGSARTITGVGFQPDWLWNKSRSNAYNHYIFDVLRGTNMIGSNATTPQEDKSPQFSAFTSDGFTITNDAGSLAINASGVTFANWCWKANGAGVSNTQGDITSTVSANTTSGFSIVKYTNPSSGSPFTVGHGLGSELKCVITKNLSVVQTWGVWHTAIGFGNYIRLDSTAASAAGNLVTATSSTTFSSYSAHHSNGNEIIAYCFAEKKGFSKFGSYTGNGSTNGTFVYTGFKPAFVMVKKYNATEDWFMYDNKRGGFNPDNFRLKANDPATEDPLSTGQIDLLSNGWKFRNSSTQYNASGDSYIYMAFAEEPLVGTNNIPATAR